MKTLNGIDFYDCNDPIYSRGGPIVLDEKLQPVGVFLPAIPGFDNSANVESLDENSDQMKLLAESYRTMIVKG